MAQILICYFVGLHHSTQGAVKPLANLKATWVKEAVFLLMGTGRDGAQTPGISLLIKYHVYYKLKVTIYQWMNLSMKQWIYTEERWCHWGQGHKLNASRNFGCISLTLNYDSSTRGLCDNPINANGIPYDICFCKWKQNAIILVEFAY